MGFISLLSLVLLTAGPLAAAEAVPVANRPGKVNPQRSARKAEKQARRGKTNPAPPTDPQKAPESPSTAAANPARPNVPVARTPTPVPAAISSDLEKVAAANNRFAFALYERLRSGDGNTFFSPVSISSALAMLSAGATGETKQQIRNVLNLDLPDDRLGDAVGDLVRMLNDTSGQHRLSLVSRLWIQKSFPVNAALVTQFLRDYGVEPGTVDFADVELARQTINAWGAEQTAGTVPELLPPGVLSDKVRLVLTNAIHFKGSWKFQFSPASTADAPFHLSAETDVTVPLMSMACALRFAQSEELQVLELPYGDSGLSMVVLLPREVDGLTALESRLNSENFAKWLALLEEHEEVHVHLPKFTFQTQHGLRDVLSALGMPRAFGDQAQFSGLSTEKELKLYDAMQSAFVDVNEEGTEAAAVFGGIGGDVPGPVPQPVFFRADHPFLFAIRDGRTGAILFLGRVTDPTP